MTCIGVTHPVKECSANLPLLAERLSTGLIAVPQTAQALINSDPFWRGGSTLGRRHEWITFFAPCSPGRTPEKYIPQTDSVVRHRGRADITPYQRMDMLTGKQATLGHSIKR